MKLAVISAVLLGTALATSALAQNAPTPQKPVLTHATKSDVSAPMRYMNVPPVTPMGDGSGEYQVPNRFLKSSPPPLGPLNRPLPHTPASATQAPPIIASFDGINSVNSQCGCLPPDTEGDVNGNYYFQWVNVAWALFDKSTGAVIPNGASNYTAGNSFWTGFGGLCESHNDGDPIVIFDQFAHRWVASQFVVPPGAPGNADAGATQCFAISTSEDALGTYYRYQFDSTYFGDYPKLGVWIDRGGSQDAYLMTTHEFDDNNNGSFVGAAYAAVQRDAMLEGRPADQVAMLRFSGQNAYGVEPVHLIGTEAPAAGSCPVFVHFDANTSDYLFWDMCLNWNVPSATTLSASPQRVAASAPFTYDFYQVAQAGTSAVLDSFGTHIMYHATARAFPYGAPERLSLAVNHTVLADQASGQAAVRWVKFGLTPQSDRIFGDRFDGTLLPEAPRPNAGAMSKTIVDEGIHNPDAATRWLPASSIDENDNLGIGYSIAGTVDPEVAINGRTAADPLGTLEAERVCSPASVGFQTSSSARWGDYSNMTVDPNDQCTFYFTTEYYATSSSAGWSTRICSFKFPNCGSGDFAVVNDSSRNLQVCEATATADPTFKLRVGALNGFNGSIALSANAPAGVTPTFSLASLNAPGVSYLTLTGARTLAPGDYSVTVNGTSAAPATRSTAIGLGISDHVPVAPTLSAPANNATGVKIYPNFSWAAIADARTYTIEVASDAAFANIVASATVTTTSWSPSTPLNASTQYYWRVKAGNYCGAGVVSAVATFTTGVPGTCPAGTTLTKIVGWNWDDHTVQGWTVAGSGGGTTANHLWTLTATPPAGTGFGTNSYAFYINDNATTSTWDLISPSVSIPAGVQSAFLQYDVYHGLEDDPTTAGCWDGLTIQTNTGSGYQYLGPTRMLTDPYSGPSDYTGAPVWCTVSGAPKHSIVDFDSFIGTPMNFEFHFTSDGSNGPVPTPAGIAIDNVEVDTCQ